MVRIGYRVGLTVHLLLASIAFGAAPEQSTRAAVGHALASLDVPFEANRGQFDADVAFHARTLFGGVFVTRRGEIVHALPAGAGASAQRWSLVERFVTTRSVGAIAAGQRADDISRFRGADPLRWQPDIAAFSRVRLGQPWRGITADLAAHGGEVEKLFTVQPGADSQRIVLDVAGAHKLSLNSEGELIAETGNGDVRFSAPLAYQVVDGRRRDVQVRYRLLANNRYGFGVGKHDRRAPLIIDPIIQSTYLGGNGDDLATAVALDAAGDVYVAGTTTGTVFPGTAGGAQPTNHDTSGTDNDIFVAKLSSDLAHVLQSTYLGGSGNEQGAALLVDGSGNVYVSGGTVSTDFPATTGGLQAHNAGNGDLFVAKLSANLKTILQATYLGGSSRDSGGSIALDGSGNLFMTGQTQSSPFPGVAGGAQTTNEGGGVNGEYDGFVAKMSGDLKTLIQSTYLGGSSDDSFSSVAVYGTSVYVCGHTLSSSDFPGVAQGAQSTFAGSYDGVVARLTTDLKTLQQSTFLGGSALDGAAVVKVDSSGNVFVGGNTYSTDFPFTFGGAYPDPSPFNAGSADGFIAELSADLKTGINATYLGGNGLDSVHALAIAVNGDIYAAGGTDSTDFPGTALGAQSAPGLAGSFQYDGFAAHLSSNLAYLYQATYLGGDLTDQVSGLAFDKQGNVYAVGYTFAQNFPDTVGGFQEQKCCTAGDPGSDGFVAKITPNLSDRIFYDGFEPLH